MSKTIYLLVVTFFSLRVWGYEPISLPWYNSQEIGEVFSMEEHPDKIFVLHFYWYNCPPSHHVQKDIVELVSEYEVEPRIQFLDVSGDSKKHFYERWLEEHQQLHPLLADKERRVFKDWEIKAVSTVIIADAKSQEFYRHVGMFNEKDIEKLTRTLQWLLEKP